MPSDGGDAQRTDSGDGGDDFTKLELVEDSGRTGRIETDLEATV